MLICLLLIQYFSISRLFLLPPMGQWAAVTVASHTTTIYHHLLSPLADAAAAASPARPPRVGCQLASGQRPNGRRFFCCCCCESAFFFPVCLRTHLAWAIDISSLANRRPSHFGSCLVEILRRDKMLAWQKQKILSPNEMILCLSIRFIIVRKTRGSKADTNEALSLSSLSH